MNENISNPVVAVTEEKKRRTGFLWIAAGTAALMLGGSTFALWSANDSIAGGTITAGDLNITAAEKVSFWDVSNDRTDVEKIPATNGDQPGHVISDIQTWKVVPGDKVAASFTTTATLHGDNLVAQLSLDGLKDLSHKISGMKYSYEVYHGDALVISETALPTEADAPIMKLSAPAEGQSAGLDDHTMLLGSGQAAVDGATAKSTVFGMPNINEDFTVVVYASFYVDQNNDFRYQASDVTVGDRVDVSAADTLADLKIKLSQVRDAGAKFKTPVNPIEPAPTQNNATSSGAMTTPTVNQP